mmetsp:Transcript_27389/g.109685  ORF Transcript_27389/g.109685 Transcript_27389/m.109685 type:complete len:214 (+) Transcript_27389:1471-2112(+)
MPLTKLTTTSSYWSADHLKAHSTPTSIRAPAIRAPYWRADFLTPVPGPSRSCSGFLPWTMTSAYSAMPPSWQNSVVTVAFFGSVFFFFDFEGALTTTSAAAWASAGPALRASTSVSRSPAFRYASSSRRLARTSESKATVEKMVSSGTKVTVVPFDEEAASASAGALVRSAALTPRSKAIEYRRPSRRTSTSSRSDSALTTERPTPCRPPATP